LLEVVHRLLGIGRGGRRRVQEHVAHRQGEVGGDRVALELRLKLVVARHGAIGGALQRVGHRLEVERALFLVVGFEKRFEVADEHARGVELVGVKKDLGHLEHGIGGRVWPCLELGEALDLALVVLFEACERLLVLGLDGGAAQGGEVRDPFALAGDDFVPWQDAAVGGEGLLVHGGAFGFLAEGGFVEEDFAELEVGVVDEGEVLFAADDSLEDRNGFVVEREGGVAVGVAAFVEFDAALGGVGEGEEIAAARDRRTRSELADVFLEVGNGGVVIGDLEICERAPVEDRFGFGGFRELLEEIGEFLNRLLEGLGARGGAGIERGCLRREDLRLETARGFVDGGRGRRPREELVDGAERLVVFPEEVIRIRELELRGGDNGGGRVVGEHLLVSRGGARVIAAEEEVVGGAVGGFRRALGCRVICWRNGRENRRGQECVE